MGVPAGERPKSGDCFHHPFAAGVDNRRVKAVLQRQQQEGAVDHLPPGKAEGDVGDAEDRLDPQPFLDHL